MRYKIKLSDCAERFAFDGRVLMLLGIYIFYNLMSELTDNYILFWCVECIYNLRLIKHAGKKMHFKICLLNTVHSV